MAHIKIDNENYWLPFKVLSSLLFSAVVYFTLVHNALNPFIGGDIYFSYSDANFIASVANNLANGSGFSYWDGFQYNFLDPDISTGPTVIFPLAAALLMGVSHGDAFYMAPAFCNSTFLFFLLVCMPFVFGKKYFCFFLISVYLFIFSNQVWHWYLPLGEVPAAIFLLLSISLLECKGNFFNYFFSGAAFSFALFSKMHVLLVFPVFLLFLPFIAGLKPLFFWMAGCCSVVFSCFLLLMWASGVDLSAFGVALKNYVIFSAWYGFPDLPGGMAIGLDKITFWDRVYYRFLAATASYGVWGFAEVVGYLCFFATVFILFFKSRKNLLKNKFILICFSCLSVFLIWYFFISIASGRYFFIPCTVGYFSSVFILYNFRIMNRILSCILSFFPIPFFLAGVFFYSGGGADFVNRPGEMSRISDYLSSKNIDEFVVDPNVFDPYADIAYYLRNKNRFYSLYAFLDRNSIILNVESCANSHNRDPLIFSIGLRNSPSFKCSHSGTVPIAVRWNNNFDGGYYMVMWRKSDSEYGDAYRHCSDLLFNGEFMRLYWCSKSELSSIVYSQSGKVVNFD